MVRVTWLAANTLRDREPSNEDADFLCPGGLTVWHHLSPPRHLCTPLSLPSPQFHSLPSPLPRPMATVNKSTRADQIQGFMN